MSPRKRKIRVDLKKNRGKKSRNAHKLRQAFEQDQTDELAAGERVSGKGDLTRKRTIVAAEPDADDPSESLQLIDYDQQKCLTGRVLSIVGSHQCRVQADDGTIFVCAVRQVLRALSQESRNAVVAGDRVQFEPLPGGQGMIHRVEPRSGTLGRVSGRSQQILVANVDLAVIVIAAVAPHYKPSLIDRFLISCEKGGVTPIICINKCDLIDQTWLLPIVGQYANLGYDVILTSAATGLGISRLRDRLQNQQSVFSGQSGVGKTSLLNAIQPGLGLPTAEVSGDSGKGRHTTRMAVLKSLYDGGWVVDTPGIRQMRLWDVHPEEIEGFFREFRPYVRYCKFPDCLHDQEQECGIKEAVASGWISIPRYESYLKIISDQDEDG